MTRVNLGIALLVSLSGHVSAQPVDVTREFLNGHRATFSTKGHAKAKGVNLTIAYPSSWAAIEGERPNVVQKFVSDSGRGFENAIIITKELPLPLGRALTEEELRVLFAPSELRRMLPPGAVFVDAQSTKIEGVPTGILEFKIRGERAGTAFLGQTWMLNFVSGNILVQIQFHVGGLSDSDIDVSQQMAAFKPLFMLMANSIIFPDKWATSPILGPATTKLENKMEPTTTVGGGFMSFVPLLILSVNIAVIANLLAKQKGRNVAAWTILGAIPVINIFGVIYFVGATNLRLEHKVDELTAEITRHKG